MEQLVIIDNNKIYIYNADEHPIMDEEEATTEDVVKALGHDFDNVSIAWGENFEVIYEH